MKLGVVLVHYHTAALAVAAHRALAADLEAVGLEADWLLVDNGSDLAGRELLDTLPVRRLDPGENLGYAGGANLGVRESQADAFFLMNPDVEVLPGCAPALLAALADGAAAAGPMFYWDHDRRFRLPPTEHRTRRDALLRLAAERGEIFARRARRRWRRHARRYWTAAAPCRGYELSGALLAFRRDAWEALDGFDEGYRLYFEETDFLERLRRDGREARFVPLAEAVHLYAQSTVGEPRSAGWFADSHRRFRRRFYGRAFTTFLEGLSRLWRPSAVASPQEQKRLGQPAWLEVSASPLGFPAAGRRLEGEPSCELPREILDRLPDGDYFLRAVDEAGAELAAQGLNKNSTTSPSAIS